MQLLLLYLLYIKKTTIFNISGSYFVAKGSNIKTNKVLEHFIKAYKFTYYYL